MADYIDTRDLQKRLEELEAERAEFIETGIEEAQEKAENEDVLREELRTQWETKNPDDASELKELNELSEEIGSEFTDGVTLIPEYDFEYYAQELAEDCGMITGSESWPLNCIDWERAARELRYDYSSIEFQGTDYLYRS